MQIRYSQATETRQHGADRTGHQKNSWLALHLLALGRFDQRALQLFGHARLQQNALFLTLSGPLQTIEQNLFQPGFQGDYGKLGLNADNALHDGATQSDAHRRHQRGGILTLAGVVRDRLRDTADITHWHLFRQQRL
ncbi:hypothetical protein D3C71_1484780 [compost metagenome]